LIKPCCLPGKTSLRQPIKEQCLQQEPDLLPRFAEHYQQLKALRRRVRRSLQRQWKRSLAGVALLIALGQAPALAATINVNGTTCTLVNAITAANNNAATGGCTAGSGADTIMLPANSTQTLTTANNTSPYGATGLPVIRSVITITGNGSTIRRDPGAPEFRVFAVSSSGNLILQHTTVSGGRLTSNNGAGITSQGAVTLTHSTITGNSSEDVIGGVFDALGGGPLSVTNSTISGNFAYSSGSTLLGLHNRSASLTSTTPEPSCRGK
jgi:hypothetical protein